MNLISFLSGISTITFVASGIFFLKFWKSSQDSFYLSFCIACWLIAVERVILVSISDSTPSVVQESHAWVYLIRLSAFAVILTGIIRKNRSRAQN